MNGWIWGDSSLCSSASSITLTPPAPQMTSWKSRSEEEEEAVCPAGIRGAKNTRFKSQDSSDTFTFSPVMRVAFKPGWFGLWSWKAEILQDGLTIRWIQSNVQGALFSLARGPDPAQTCHLLTGGFNSEEDNERRTMVFTAPSCPLLCVSQIDWLIYHGSFLLVHISKCSPTSSLN